MPALACDFGFFAVGQALVPREYSLHHSVGTRKKDLQNLLVVYLAVSIVVKAVLREPRVAHRLLNGVAYHTSSYRPSRRPA
jgi:hypothetical protein